MLTKFYLCLSIRHPPIVCAYLYSVLFRQLKTKKEQSRVVLQ